MTLTPSLSYFLSLRTCFLIICAGLASVSSSVDLRATEEDPSIKAYRERCETIIQGNLTALKSWASANAAATNLGNPGRKMSIWTAAAGFSRGGQDKEALSAARLLSASLMASRLNHPFGGGNDGWPAWGTADTRLRYADFIVSDPARYAPPGYPANSASKDGKYSLDDLFRIVLTQSYYAPIDSTGNHYLMNATARFLAEIIYPGQVVKPFNNNKADPLGAKHILGRVTGLEEGGPGEYGSPNYGADNWAEFLSLAQLTPTNNPLNASVKQASEAAFCVALADAAAFWMNGNLAMPTGRGYPTTGAWGVAAGDVLTWVYAGGDFGNPKINEVVCDTGEKTLGVLGAVAMLAGYSPPIGLLHVADRVPRVTQANFGNNRQYSYMTRDYGHSCESYKDGAHGGWQTHWDSRVVWTKPYNQIYQATAWVSNVGINASMSNGVPTPHLEGKGTPMFVDPIMLQPYPTHGSGTYGQNCYEDFTQSLDTVLHVCNIPPKIKAGTPGGTMPVRGSLIYLPVPQKMDQHGVLTQATDDYIPPFIAKDGKRVYVGFNSVFIAFISSAPIATPKPTDIIDKGRRQFFRIYGGPSADLPVDPEHYIQYAVAVQTASPADYPGSSLAEKFAAFTGAMDKLPVPKMSKVDQLHPVWQFSNGKVTLSSTYQGDQRHGGNDGKGEDWIGGPNDENPQQIDYYHWPQLRESFVGSTQPILDQPQKGNLTISNPGHPTVCVDFKTQMIITEGSANGPKGN